MKSKMKINCELIKQDIKSAVPVLGIVTLVIVMSNIILGRICPLRMIFGIPCPGCGITRAFLLALQGRFHEATEMHLFWIPLTILVIVFLTVRYFVADEKLLERSKKVIKTCFIILMILLVIYYIYRMIMWYPNKEPMVYDTNNVISRILKNEIILKYK